MDNVLQSLTDWIKSTIKDTVGQLVALSEKSDDFHELLNVAEVCDFLGINYDTFRDHYRYREDFPREMPAKRWSKRAIIKWLENQI